MEQEIIFVMVVLTGVPPMEHYWFRVRKKKKSNLQFPVSVKTSSYHVSLYRKLVAVRKYMYNACNTCMVMTPKESAMKLKLATIIRQSQVNMIMRKMKNALHRKGKNI